MKALNFLKAAPKENAVFETAQSTVRTLMAAFILAGATALMIDPAQPVPLGGMLGADTTFFVAVFLFLIGGALMLGAKVRLASLAFAGYLLVSGAVHVGLTDAPAQAALVGGDLTLLATILLIMLSETSVQEKRVTPRRVRPLPAGPMAEPPSSRRLDRFTAVKTQLAVETIAKREAQIKEAAEREARAAMVAGKAPPPKTAAV